MLLFSVSRTFVCSTQLIYLELSEFIVLKVADNFYLETLLSNISPPLNPNICTTEYLTTFKFPEIYLLTITAP